MKKRSDGRYAKQIFVGYDTDGKRKMKTIYGKTMKEVQQKEIEIRKEIEDGCFVDANSITVGEWSIIWLKTFKIDIAYNTYYRYEGIINKYIIPHLGELKLQDVRLDLIQYLIIQLSKKLSSASVKKIKDALHQIFEQAIIMGYIAKNPVNGVSMPKSNEKERSALSDEEVLDLCEFCKTNSRGALIMTLLYTGMRRGELLAFTKADVDLKTRSISIDKSVEFINGKPNVKAPKTKMGRRVVPILDPLLPYIEHLIEGKNMDEPVFSNSQGKHISLSSIRYFYKCFIKEYNDFLKAKYPGIEEVYFTMHQFRHTYCTLLYKAQVDVKTAQELLGHSSVNVTLGIYTHIDKKLRDINAEKINSYIQNMSLNVG